MNTYEFLKSQGQRSIVLHVPESLHSGFKAACKQKGTTMSAAIQNLLKQFIEESNNRNQ
jgi:hypothetical protein